MTTLITAKNVSIINTIADLVCQNESYITEEVVGKIVDKLVELDQAGHEVRSVKAWAYRLARNLRIDILIAEGRRTSAHRRAMKFEETHEPGMLTDFDATIRETLIKALDKPLEIVAIEGPLDGESFSDLSDLYDVPVNTLLSHARRARQHLATKPEVKKLYADWQDRMRAERIAVPTARYTNVLS